MKYEFTYRGQHYVSHVPKVTFVNRLHDGWTVEAALGPKVPANEARARGGRKSGRDRKRIEVSR